MDKDLIQKMYLGFYGRAADLGGMNYWQALLDKDGFAAIAMAFVTSPEAEKLYTKERIDAANALTYGDNPPVVPPVDPPPSSGKIQWLLTKAEAIAAAKAQGRKIFLLAGQESCSVTQGMRDFICELPSLKYPNAKPIKALILNNFIPWFADTEGKGHIEYEQYAPYGSFQTPLMCVIGQDDIVIPKPDSAGLMVKYLNGNKTDEALFAWLSQYV